MSGGNKPELTGAGVPGTLRSMKSQELDMMLDRHLTDRVSVQEGAWHSGTGPHVSVRIEIDGALANDLSALLLTLPPEQYERFRILSSGLDRFISRHGTG